MSQPDRDRTPAARYEPGHSVCAAEAARPGRPAYVAPVLEHLGPWSALTLQQSVGISLFDTGSGGGHGNA